MKIKHSLFVCRTVAVSLPESLEEVSILYICFSTTTMVSSHVPVKKIDKSDDELIRAIFRDGLYLGAGL